MAISEETGPPFVPGMYDYYLGGSANTAVDRAAAEEVLKALPEMRDAAWSSRGFLQRAVARMAGEWGIRQFIDLGAGLPTQRHVHEVVRETIGANEKASVVYVDVDPRVIQRGRQILDGIPGTAVIQGDLGNPQALLANPELRALIDFSQPVALLMILVVNFIPPDKDPHGAVRTYLDALVPGSYLALSSPTGDHQSEEVRDRVKAVYAKTPTPGGVHTREEVTRFFDGLEIVPPYEGAAPEVTFAGLWAAEDAEMADDDGTRWVYAAVGRKP
jgi:hypothetical protein